MPNSFSENYLFYLLNEALLPQIILYGLYFIIAKDDVRLKIKSYFPLVCSFYCLYLPYCVISANESEIYSGFCIFVKPLIYFAMLCQCDICLNEFLCTGKLKIVRKIIVALLLIVYLALPALIETLYVMNILPALVIILSILYVLVPLALYLLKMIKNKIKK
ncbi:MAG: hypothetical protein K6A43_10745 [Treponema sp.]|nr:hypothetical protein [Treponema sp.]